MHFLPIFLGRFRDLVRATPARLLMFGPETKVSAEREASGQAVDFSKGQMVPGV
jgi:hypothetical protein